jgi:hypothetical protein
MSAEIDAFSRDLMLGINRSEAYANMAANTTNQKEAIHNLRLAIKELHYILESIGFQFRRMDNPNPPMPTHHPR